MKMKEIAKFAAGVTAWEAIVHTSYAAANVLPLNFFGFRLTPPVNRVQIIVPALVSVALIYYAWGRK